LDDDVLVGKPRRQVLSNITVASSVRNLPPKRRRSMTRVPIIRCALAVTLLGGGTFLAETVPAQTPCITAKPLLRTSLSGDEGKETVVLDVEIAPGATTGRHKHPGDEYATVLQGTLELRVEWRDIRRVSAGTLITTLAM
jgi:hypothetical protein